MAIETSFTIKQLNVDEALKQAENKVKKSAETMDNTLNKKPVEVKVKPFGEKVKAELEKVKKGIEAAGISGEKFGKVGDVFAAGKVAGAVAVVALGAKYIYTSVTGLWDKLNLSSEEYLSKQAQKAKDANAKNVKIKKEQDESQSYIDRLSELSDAENTSNAAKTEAIALIDLLTKKYGDLGISIDEATGHIFGLDDAQNKMLAKNRTERIAGLTSERDSIQRQASAQSGVAAYTINRNPFSGWAEDIFKDFGLEKSSTTSVKDMFSQVQNTQPLDKQIKFFETVRDEMKTQPDMDSVQKIIDLKKQELELQNKINGLTKNGNESDAEYAKRLRDKTTKDKVSKYQGEASTEYAKQRGQTEAQDDLKRAAAYDKLRTTTEQIASKEKQVSDEKEKQINLQKNIDRINSAYAQGAGNEVQKASDVAAIAKLESEIGQSKGEQLKIEIEIEKLKQKSADYYRDSKEKLDGELEVQKALNDGRNEEAERLRIINELKAKGLDVDMAEVDALMAKKKELAGLKFSDSMKQSGYDLLYKQGSKVNYKQAEYEKRVRDKEKELGVSLDDAQKSKIKSQIQLEIDVNSEPKLDLRGTDIKTNELTARGGFASGAVVVDKDRVNQQIRDYNARQVSLLQQIKTALQSEGKI